jgi:hypothetical protein
MKSDQVRCTEPVSLLASWLMAALSLQCLLMACYCIQAHAWVFMSAAIAKYAMSNSAHSSAVRATSKQSAVSSCVSRSVFIKAAVSAVAIAAYSSTAAFAEEEVDDEPLPPVVLKAIARYTPLIVFAGDYYSVDLKAAVENTEVCRPCIHSCYCSFLR